MKEDCKMAMQKGQPFKATAAAPTAWEAKLPQLYDNSHSGDYAGKELGHVKAARQGRRHAVDDIGSQDRHKTSPDEGFEVIATCT